MTFLGMGRYYTIPPPPLFLDPNQDLGKNAKKFTFGQNVCTPQSLCKKAVSGPLRTPTFRNPPFDVSTLTKKVWTGPPQKLEFPNFDPPPETSLFWGIGTFSGFPRKWQKRSKKSFRGVPPLKLQIWHFLRNWHFFGK